MEARNQKVIFVLAGIAILLAAIDIYQWKKNMISKNQPVEVPITLERNGIDSKYKWNLADIYPTQDDFNRDLATAQAGIKEFPKFSGTLNSDENIKKALDIYYALSQKVSRIGSYAHLFSDQDTRSAEGMSMRKTAELLGADFGQAGSFIDPELLRLPKSQLETLAENPQFKDYHMLLVDLIRNKDHILSNQEESLLAQTSIIQGSGYNIYNTFINSDLKYPEVKLSDGQKLELTQSLFEKYRENPNREDRRIVFEAFLGTLGKYQNSFAQMLSAQVDANIFSARTRKFDSALQASLFGSNVPTSVYEKIIEEINANLPVLDDYLALKKKILGLNQMDYYDLYAPVTGGLKDTYTYEQADQIIQEALQPMGENYEKVASKVIKPGSGWIDVFPSQGKTNGAYSSAVYGVHPYILMNFNGRYNSVSTEIHELGHTMHSYYSMTNQPYPESEYSIFVAEIASTFNENLLLENRLKQETDKDKKIALLGESLETMRTTVFRQALFAEFEYKIYQAAENKIPLTPEFLNRTYLDLVKKYYGQEKGVIGVDDAVGPEWAYVPHFYYNFYVYQYVSGYLIGLALSERVLGGDTAIRDAYIEKVLKNGGARYPLDQLKDVGIDLTSDDMYQADFKVFQKRIEQLKELTNQK